MNNIELKNISKKFNNNIILDDINIDIKSGELIALLGPSGSGKTTLLRIIAGLEYANTGSIFVDDIDLSLKKIKDRKIGFVFQHYALFNHMTIYDNIAFGLKMHNYNVKLDNQKIKERVEYLINFTQLNNLENRYPSQLSGGQKQRVALARAIAVSPNILLLDEPFAALDSKVRSELRRWIRKLHDDTHLTTIFVTHDQEEAMEIADRIVIMNHGKIEQIGTASEVYHFPKNSFTYNFLGNVNIFDAYIKDNGEYIIINNIKDHNRQLINKKQPNSNFLKILLDIFKKIFSKIDNKSIIMEDKSSNTDKKSIKIFARPYNMAISKTYINNNSIFVKIININQAGPLIKLELEDCDNHIIQSTISHTEFNKLELKKGDNIYTYPKEIQFF